jgi:hypothetical protein
MRTPVKREPRDKQIIVRASESEMNAWFQAAERVAGRDPVSLSRCVRKLLNDWAERINADKGGK